MILFQSEGALNPLGEEHSPVGNRAARYVLDIAASWETAGDDRANIQRTRDAWSKMKSFLHEPNPPTGLRDSSMPANRLQPTTPIE
jgi:hypothetical protein